MGARGVIVYLAQVRHSSYHRSSLANLVDSLTLLHQNYNAVHRHPVIIWHTGDFGKPERRQVLAPIRELGAPTYEINFELVPEEHWRLPASLDGWRRNSWISLVASETGLSHKQRLPLCNQSWITASSNVSKITSIIIFPFWFCSFLSVWLPCPHS